MNPLIFDLNLKMPQIIFCLFHSVNTEEKERGKSSVDILLFSWRGVNKKSFEFIMLKIVFLINGIINYQPANVEK